MVEDGPTRIRRGMSIPTDIANAEREIFDIAYPHFVWVSKDGRYNLRYRNRGFNKLCWDTDEVLSREVDCWLCNADERVGMMQFKEWKIFPFLSERAFIEIVDGHSAATYKFGTAFVSAWRLLQVAPYGTIVEFHRLWVRPDHARGIWAMAANRFIQRQFSRRAALIVLQAFPLEYEGRCSEGSPQEAGLQSRTAAMMRLYARVLKVQPTPRGTLAGEQNWMWRSLKTEVPPPRRRRLSWL